MGAGDETSVARAAHLFDDVPSREWTALFLDDPGHHLFIAYGAGEFTGDSVPVGFVSGTEVYHPDQAPTMFLNELGVDLPYRGRGIGRALVDALSQLAASRGCTSTWVLTERDNLAALAIYDVGDAARDDHIVMVEWEHEPAD
jgi:ribosomal-protein-alanine N-acetyltransferase